MIRFDRASLGALNIAKRVSKLPLLAILFSVLVTIWGTAGAADTDSFFEQTLTASGKVLMVLPLQFDGTGANELATVIRDEQRGYRMQVHRESTTRNYETTPLLSFDIPANVFALQAVDIDGDKRTEIVFLALESLYCLDFDNGGFSAQPKLVSQFDRLFAVPPLDMIVNYDFMFDLNGDGKLDAVLPSWEGIRIFKRELDNYAFVKTILVNTGSRAHIAQNQFATSKMGGLGLSLPTIGAFDINSDRSKDIVVASGNGMAVCYQVGSLQFSGTPSQLLDVRAAFLDDLRFMSWDFGDLNGDKVTDYCRVFTQGHDDEYKTVIEIYLASGQSGFSQRPSKRIVIDEYCLGLVLMDLEGNGTASAIVATVGVSPTSLVKALLVKRMQVDLNIFQAQSGILSETPTAVKKIGCGIDFFGNVPAQFVGCAHGDFEKDRFKDLVSLNDDDEIEIYRGARGAQFSDKPVITRELQRCNLIDTDDLNGDGKSDLVVLSCDELGRDLITLLWSK